MSEQQAAPAQPTTEFSQEQVNQMKASLIQRVNAEYGKFMQFLATIPCEPALRGKAVSYLDDGFVWFEKAIAVMNVVTKAVQVEPQEEPAPQPEPKNGGIVPPVDPTKEAPASDAA